MMIYDVYIDTHMQQTEEEFSAAVRLYGNERLSQTSAPSNCHRTIDSLSLYSPLYPCDCLCCLYRFGFSVNGTDWYSAVVLYPIGI